MAETHVIEVRAGRGEPPTLELRPGLELAPLSVGTGGAWQVSAPGVRAVHLYLYFDGQTLFLQSAEASDPPRMDGRPVPASWTPAPARCSITFGQATLAFHPADDAGVPSGDDPTFAEPMPEPAARQAPRPPPAAPAPRDVPARPFKPGAFVSGAADDESTRIQPAGLDDYGNGPDSDDSTRVEPLNTGGSGGARGVRPAAGAPFTRPAPTPAAGGGPPPQGGFQPQRQFPPPPSGPPSEPTGAAPQGQGGPPSGLLNVPPPSVRAPDAPETFPDRVKREWAAAPPLRKGLVAALPVAILLAFWVTLSGGSPPPPPSQNTSSNANGSSTSASTPPVPTTAPTPLPPPPPWPPPPPPADPNVAAQRPPVPSARPTAAAATEDGGAPIDRRERQAADAVATHNYDQAIRLYDALAAERPQNPAFHEAARILRGKLESGTP